MTFVGTCEGHRAVAESFSHLLGCGCCHETVWVLEVDGKSDDWSPFDSLTEAQDRAEKAVKSKMVWKEDDDA